MCRRASKAASAGEALLSWPLMVTFWIQVTSPRRNMSSLPPKALRESRDASLSAARLVSRRRGYGVTVLLGAASQVYGDRAYFPALAVATLPPT
jgi:hypothetical protein